MEPKYTPHFEERACALERLPRGNLPFEELTTAPETKMDKFCAMDVTSGH